jgi:hypothetical protein
VHLSTGEELGVVLKEFLKVGFRVVFLSNKRNETSVIVLPENTSSGMLLPPWPGVRRNLVA